MRRLALAALSGTLLLAGCGGGSAAKGTASSSSPTAAAAGASAGSSAASSSGASASPCPSTQTTNTHLPKTSAVKVSASGSYGDKPTLSFTGTPDPAHLGVKVVSPGRGPVVRSGELLEADYLGQVWNGKVFDNSYDRKASATFPIGVGQVVPGWDQGLVGQKVGSRVLLSLPPSEGYGCQGQSSAGIKGTDTIVFVVDIVDAFGQKSAGQANATRLPTPKGLPVVTGALGAPATISLPKGYEAPAKPRVTVIARGTGPKVTSSVFVNYAAVQTDGKKESSWTSKGGQVQNVPTSSAQGSPFAKLKGLPVGSRVVVEVPADTKAKRPAAAFVLDLLAVPETAKQAAATR